MNEIMEAAFHFVRQNPKTTKEELVQMYGLTLEDSASVIDAFECWNTPFEEA